VYREDARAMNSIVQLLKEAVETWQQSQQPSPSSSSSSSPLPPSSPLSSYLRRYPPSLLIDCIDFLSFLCLRHSVVFRRFAKEQELIPMLAKLFPKPQLTPEEVEEERKEEEEKQKRKQQLEQQQQAAIKPEETAVPPVDGSTAAAEQTIAASSPSVAPPAESTAAPTAPTFIPPAVTLPPTVLCACLRFFRICVEVDASYIRPVRRTNRQMAQPGARLL
jgi:hypothetical protein